MKHEALVFCHPDADRGEVFEERTAAESQTTGRNAPEHLGSVAHTDLTDFDSALGCSRHATIQLAKVGSLFAGNVDDGLAALVRLRFDDLDG